VFEMAKGRRGLAVLFGALTFNFGVMAGLSLDIPIGAPNLGSTAFTSLRFATS